MEPNEVGMVTQKANRVLRHTVNCCFVCRLFAVSDDDEHEDGGGKPYCLYDGSNISPALICKHFEKSTRRHERVFRLVEIAE